MMYDTMKFSDGSGDGDDLSRWPQRFFPFHDFFV